MSEAGRQRNARLNQAKKHAIALIDHIEALRGTNRHAHVNEPEWKEGRDTLNRLVQCFHEANACNNLAVEIKNE